MNADYDKRELVILGLSILLLFAMIMYGAHNFDQDNSDNGVNVSIDGVTCVDYNNNTVCWTKENKSKVNLSQLTDG